MPDRIRFHLDEHVDPAIAAGLQRYGVDVTTTIAAALRTKDDEVHLAFANAEHRVIVTEVRAILTRLDRRVKDLPLGSSDPCENLALSVRLFACFPLFQFDDHRVVLARAVLPADHTV